MGGEVGRIKFELSGENYEKLVYTRLKLLAKSYCKLINRTFER